MTSTALPSHLSFLLPRSTSFARTSLQLRCHASRKYSAFRTTSSLSRTFTCLEHTRQSGLLHEKAAAPSLLKRRWHATNNTSPASASPPQEPGAQRVYTPPTTGLLSHLPASWLPYAELIRLDKPTGTYYLFLPCLFSTLLAAPLTSPITPPSTILSTSFLFLSGALIMRGAGCTINDIWDRNLDPHVARTRLRPIARGAISIKQAIPFLGVQLLAGLAVLLRFPPVCLIYGIPSLLLVGTYPLAKRVTNYPQLVLGLTFSWGAIMGFPALGIDLLTNTPALVAAACLYGSCVAWTVVYDMIYAYQDIRFDAAAGIKSIALAQEGNAKTFLACVSAVQVALLAGVGVVVGAGPVYFVGTCGGAALTLGYMIKWVDLSCVEDCWAWFRSGAWFTGGAIALGLAGEYWARYTGMYKEIEEQMS